MLTSEETYVLELLRHGIIGAVTGAPAPEPAEALDAMLVANIIHRNGILLTVFPSLVGLPEVRDRLEQAYYATASQVVNQVHEGEQILNAYVDAGLACMPLKGWETRILYPRPNMRQMADFDVLVRPYDYAAVERIMVNLGFEATSGETAWKHDNFAKGTVAVEVHKRLTDDSGAVRDWEVRMWERALANQAPTDKAGLLVHMPLEDQYIFHFVHMHKDMLNGSLGLRRIVDTWLFDQRLCDMDHDYVMRELDTLGLSTFRERMRMLGRACMGEEPTDEDMGLLLEHAFSCGIYGNGKSYKMGRIARMSKGREGCSLLGGKIRSVSAAVFLPLGRMKAQYPELDRWPALLPVCWVRRIVSYLTDGHLKEYRAKLDYSSVTDADVERMRRVLEASGIELE